jgi:predicted nuclease with TOPRIM domain
MRITNLDTLSAMLDRLVTENIKKFFFEKDGLNDKIEHQVKVIDELKEKISELFHECYNNKKYNYMSEKRTWKDDDVVEDISELT